MKKTLLLLSAATAAVGASAQQISITSGAGLTYTQNFNTLDSATTSTTGGTTLPNGWYIAEMNTGTGTAADTKYRSGNGSTNNGDTYSYGAAASADRSLGSLASNSLYSMHGARFQNNAGSAITRATVTLKMEQWRVGDTASRPDTTTFEYSTSATGIGDTSAAAGWVEVPAMMLNSMVTVATSTTGNMVDGNAAANSKSVTGTFTLNVPNGGTLYFRWKDKNIVGSDDGLSIDDLNVVFSTTQGVNNTNAVEMPLTLLENGTSNSVKATFTAPENGAFTVAVTDLAGRVVATTEGTAVKGQTVVMPVGAQALPAGMYLVRVAQGVFTGSAKLSVR